MAANIGILDSALGLIASANLTPTEHLLLQGFVNGAVDPEHAARYVSQRVKDSGDRNVEDALRELKQDWKQLVLKFSRKEDVSLGLMDLVKSRDGSHCCLTPNKSKLDARSVALIEPAWIIPPKLFDDEQMALEGSLLPLLNAFLTPAKTLELQKIVCDRNEAHALKNLWLLSPSIYAAFRNGHVRVTPFPYTGQWTWDEDEDDQKDAMTAEYNVVQQSPERPTELYFSDGTSFSSFQKFTVHTGNPVTHCLPSPFLFHVHYTIASSLHLFFIEERISAGWPSKSLFTLSKPTQQKISQYLYPSNHIWVRQLPFGLYMKIGVRSGQNEAVALRLLEKHTSSVPAPLWVDDYEEDSTGDTVLIMTQMQGQPLGDVFHRLSCKEREQLSKDLKVAIHQLRCIPNRTPYRFGNAFGGTLFDYRVGTFGPFSKASEFHAYIIPEHTVTETRRAMNLIHSRHQMSFFTHADINWRNILIDQGRLAGLVDWECAGYFPQYWEFTKAIYLISNHKAMENVIRDAFDEDYEEELKVERTLWDLSPWGI